MDMNNYLPIYPLAFPGIRNFQDQEEVFLSSLDSDTREYVRRHTEKGCSRDEMEHCVAELRGH